MVITPIHLTDFVEGMVYQNLINVKLCLMKCLLTVTGLDLKGLSPLYPGQTGERTTSGGLASMTHTHGDKSM